MLRHTRPRNYRTPAQILARQANVTTAGIFVGLLAVMYCTLQLHTNKVLIRETGESLVRIEQSMAVSSITEGNVTLGCYIEGKPVPETGGGLFKAQCAMELIKPLVGEPAPIEDLMKRDDM